MRERIFEVGGFPLLTSIDTFLITHLHFDHTISIPGLWLSGWLYGRRIPMNVYGPSGTEKMMEHMRKAYQWDIEYRGIVGVPLQGSELRAQDLKAGEIINIGGLKITAFAVEHMPIIIQSGKSLGLRGDTLGFRIDYKDRSVVFSGDTRSTNKSKLIEFGKDVDVLIHEVQVPSPGNSKEAKLANVSLSVHSTPEQTAYILSRTKPRLAVYSHIIPPGTTERQLIEATRPFYKGPLRVAHDFMRITISDEIEIETVKRTDNQSFEKSNVLDN
jgi:ribonuclease Z